MLTAVHSNTKSHNNVICTYFPRRLCGQICTKIRFGRHISDAVICIKFYCDRFMDFDSEVGL